MAEHKYIRDTETNAILETNLTALQHHRLRRKMLKGKENRIMELENRIDKLENMLTELLKDKF